MKQISILLSLLALNGCSYFDNVWSCIQYADTHNNGVTNYLEFNEYNFSTGIVSNFSASYPEILSETMGKKDLVSELYSAFLQIDIDIFENPFNYRNLIEIEEDSLYIRFKKEDVLGEITPWQETIIKEQPNSEIGSMLSKHGPVNCKKTRVSGWGMEFHFPDYYNFEL